VYKSYGLHVSASYMRPLLLRQGVITKRYILRLDSPIKHRYFRNVIEALQIITHRLIQAKYTSAITVITKIMCCKLISSNSYHSQSVRYFDRENVQLATSQPKFLCSVTCRDKHSGYKRNSLRLQRKHLLSLHEHYMLQVVKLLIAV
jgi:hypothetical protein